MIEQGRLQSVVKEPVRIGLRLLGIAQMAVFLSRPGQALWRLWLERRCRAVRPDVRVGMVAHVYYIDLLHEILSCWRSLPAESRLHVTVPVERAVALRSALAGQIRPQEAGRLHVHPLPNRGRDIAPFMSLLQAGSLDAYDAVLKVHTKKSPHLVDGTLRRRLLLTILAGLPPQASRIAALFSDASVGMVGFRRSFRTRAAFWMDNRQRVLSLSQAMTPAGPAPLGFFEGSMFWVRPSALAPLRSLGLVLEDYEPEAGQLDGTLHHAIERLFTIAVWRSGGRVVDLAGRVLEPADKDSLAATGDVRAPSTQR